MILPIWIGDGVIKANPPSHTLKTHTCNQGVQKLASNNLCSILNLYQLVQRVGDRKDRVVPEGVVGGLL